jgi:hypothetical protein
MDNELSILRKISKLKAYLLICKYEAENEVKKAIICLNEKLKKLSN